MGQCQGTQTVLLLPWHTANVVDPAIFHAQCQGIVTLISHSADEAELRANWINYQLVYLYAHGIQQIKYDPAEIVNVALAVATKTPWHWWHKEQS